MTNKYVIRNCPCYDANGDEYDCSWEYSKELYCQDCTDCVLKRIYEDVKTVYRTPEYFEELAKGGDKEQELIESAWHNLALMVIGKLDIEEVE